MEGTIPKGSALILSKNDTIKVGKMIAFKPRGSKEINVLRVIGLPGDKIEIINGGIFCNGEMYNLPASSKKIWVVFCKNPSQFKALENYSFIPYSTNYSYFSLTDIEYKEIVNSKIVDSIYRISADSNEILKAVLQTSISKYRNRYFFGPIKIPIRNSIVDNDVQLLTADYFDENDFGNRIDEDFYFCIGDNFPEAKDSRFIGLIPKRIVIGTVTLQQ